MPPNTPGLHDLDHVAKLRRIAKAARRRVLDMRSTPDAVSDPIAMRSLGLTCEMWWDDESYKGKPRNPYHVLRIAYVTRAVTREFARAQRERDAARAERLPRQGGAQ